MTILSDVSSFKKVVFLFVVNNVVDRTDVVGRFVVWTLVEDKEVVCSFLVVTTDWVVIMSDNVPAFSSSNAFFLIVTLTLAIVEFSDEIVVKDDSVELKSCAASNRKYKNKFKKIYTWKKNKTDYNKIISQIW